MSIVVSEVTKFYGDQKALDNVSFQVNTGEIVAFLDLTVQEINNDENNHRIYPASSGSVLVNGIETSTDNLESGIGYLPENNPLYPEMYVREYLKFVAALYKTGGSAKNIENIIELTGLAPEQRKDRIAFKRFQSKGSVLPRP